jgi:hypothetical protein
MALSNAQKDFFGRKKFLQVIPTKENCPLFPRYSQDLFDPQVLRKFTPTKV